MIFMETVRPFYERAEMAVKRSQGRAGEAEPVK